MVSGSSWQTDSVHLYLAGDEDITGFLPDIIYKGTLLQIRFKVKVNKLTVYASNVLCSCFLPANTD